MPVTHQIRDTAIDLLSGSPDGMSTSELNRAVGERHPDFHPKTINGVIWLLHEKNPELVHKPKRGLFMHMKYRK